MPEANATSDVVIIGGGIIGLSIAWHLAGQGASVTLCDAGRCGRAASWAGAGILHPGSAARDDPLAQLRRTSAAIYPDFVAALAEATGIDSGYERSGLLDLITDDNQQAAAERELRAAAGQMLDDGRPRLLRVDREDLERMVSGIDRRVRGALYVRDAAQVRNPRLLAALIAACRARGVAIREHTPVREILHQNRRVCGVRTASDRIAGGQVVLAAGAWSSLVPGPAPRAAGVHPVRGQIVLLECSSRPFRPVLQSGKHYLVPRPDGLVLVGSTEEPQAGFEDTPTADGVRKLTELAMRFVPPLKAARFLRAWAGLRPATRDGRPLLGRAPGCEGLWVATGHFRSGVVLAPLTGRLMAQWITHGKPASDLSLEPFSPGRLADH